MKEIAIGSTAALLVYALAGGYDVTPVIFLAGILILMRFLVYGKEMGRKFEVLGGPEQKNAPGQVTFADIGGQEEAKREFREALELLRRPEQAARLGVRPLKGILLVGPPGTGKTLMAKAAASFTDSYYLAASGSQFVEMYAGVGAQRVRKIFQEARSLAGKAGKKSAIIFIDEIEVLGGKRGKHTSHLEYDQTLNELLVQMDGIGSDKEKVKVLVVAATNRADLLDGALLRPGRFDRMVRVDLPDQEGRLHILKIHARRRPLHDDVDLTTLAKETCGFSGAHLEAMVNEAAILAMRENRETITAADFKEAIDKVLMGEKLDRRLRHQELERIAYHEVGHALISELVKPGSVSVVTVTPRGQSLGYIRRHEDNDQYLYTEEDLMGQIRICLAGAVAEKYFTGSRSTGAAGDYRQAVDLAERLIKAGLSDLGAINPDTVPTKSVHEETQRLIKGEEKTVVLEIERHAEQLAKAAAALLADERISGSRFRELVGLPEIKPESAA